jgi:hypothetical protein
LHIFCELDYLLGKFSLNLLILVRPIEGPKKVTRGGGGVNGS